MEPRESSAPGAPADEEALELPASDGGLDDAPASPEDDSDLGLGADGASEDVGLDVSEGTDDPLGGDLGGSDADEATRWSVDSEEARDLEAEPEPVDGAEYGWTHDNEPADDGEDLDDGEFGENDAGIASDRGEEGPDDADDANADVDGDAVALPPLDSGADGDPDEDEPFALEVLRELTGGAIPDEPEPKAPTP